jgi:putative addiction module component (TIGR02574 family)
MNMQKPSISEKILLAEQLWESVRVEASCSDLTLVQRQELDNRLAAFEIDRDAGGSWGAVKNRIMSS